MMASTDDEIDARIEAAKAGAVTPPPGRFSDDDDPNLLPHPGAEVIPLGRGPVIEWISGPAIFDPLPKIPWVSRELYLAPGRPAQLQGFGYSGKTVAAMHLALCVASGRPIWGHFPCERGKVMHVDHEQGRWATQRRYQRLAYADALTPHDIEDRLRFTPLPPIRLTDATAEQWLLRESDGHAICIIDSLRATLGAGLEENDSAVRLPIDKLLRVSEKTGCVFVLIHHAGKGQREDMREAGRGSSAIFDAAGTVLTLESARSGENGVTVSKVTMTKAAAEASGSALQPFWLRIEDVASDDASDMRAGLRVSYKETWEDEDKELGLVIDKQARVLETLRQQARPLNTVQIEALIGGVRKGIVGKALVRLELEGRVKADRKPSRLGGNTWTHT